jgi:TatD DNase family protein
MYSDSHLHLDAIDETRRPAIMEQAARERVVLLLTTGLDIKTSQQAVSIAKQYPSVYAGIGYHPSRAVPVDDGLYRTLIGLAESEKVTVVSEVGLDTTWQGAPPMEIQEACFRRHVQLAKELSLPLQLHVGVAHREALQILQDEDALGLGGAIHEQIVTETDLDIWLPSGYYLTVGMAVVQPDAGSEELARVVRRIPNERLLLETDTYNDPGQGDLVGPARVRLVAEKVAEMKGMNPLEIGQVSTNNLRRFLRIAN